MSYELNMKNFGEFICLTRQSDKKLKKSSFNNHICNTNIEELIIDDNISLIKWQFKTNEDIKIFGEFKSDCVDIKMSLNGGIFIHEENTNTDTIIKKNNIASFSTNEVKGFEGFKKNTQYKNMSILIKKDYANKLISSNKKILKDIKDTNYFKQLDQKALNLHTMHTANELFNFSIEHDLDKIKTQSLVLDLMYRELNHLNELEDTKITNHVKFSEYDIDALKKAKQILLKDLKNPPSITELSKQVKLNEFKLKYGFKIHFDNTPYSLLLNKRMQEAKNLLESSEYNINEISSIIGYKQSSNFSKAFFKKYGMLPKEIMKTRKYYY